MYNLLLDLVRVAHLFGFAIGFGSAVLLEFVIVSKLSRGLSRGDLNLVRAAHDLITLAVGVLWVTGLALVWFRTSGDLSAFSPKLITKLVVVVMLTINMMLIARLLMPALQTAPKGMVALLPTPTRIRMGAIGGLSAGCWFSALILGAATSVKPMGFETLVAIFGPLIVIPMIIGALVAYRLRPQSDQPEGQETAA